MGPADGLKKLHKLDCKQPTARMCMKQANRLPFSHHPHQIQHEAPLLPDQVQAGRWPLSASTAAKHNATLEWSQFLAVSCMVAPVHLMLCPCWQPPQGQCRIRPPTRCWRFQMLFIG